jgi:hypothetical protein
LLVGLVWELERESAWVPVLVSVLVLVPEPELVPEQEQERELVPEQERERHRRQQ